MKKLHLTIACGAYDRVQALMDGRVLADGLDLNFLSLAPEEVFFRAFRNGEFEVSELSLSTTLMLLSRGECPYTPIPIFPSRSFRHSCIYVRADAGIETPADLKGRALGISEYQVTAAMVARGVLQDEYGVHPNDLDWIQAGLEQPGRIDKVQWDAPAGLKIRKIQDRSIADMLANKELDAVITPRAPSAFKPDGSGAVRRLFPDHANEEAAWYEKTGIFPIMHVIGVRNDILERYPWVAGSLVKAFTASKDIALAELNDATALKAALPFLPAHVSQAHRLFGDDFWPYGIEANRASLEAALRWSGEQGLSARTLSLDELFPSQTTEAFKI